MDIQMEGEGLIFFPLHFQFAYIPGSIAGGPAIPHAFTVYLQKMPCPENAAVMRVVFGKVFSENVSREII